MPFEISLETVAVVLSVLAIWLTARRHMLCWPFGLVSSLLYGKVFFDARLYSDTGLQGLFAVAVVYGWVAWARDARRGRAKQNTASETAGEGGDALAPVPLPWPPLLGWLALGAAGAGALGWFTSTHTDAALPWLDATLTSFSLVAQVWTARRHTASWALWIAVDIVYVGMFAGKGLHQTAGLYALLTVLAIDGLRRWARATRTQAATGIRPAASPTP